MLSGLFEGGGSGDNVGNNRIVDYLKQKNMAHNPKLNVYTLRLNPKDDSVETFRDLFKLKYNCDTSVSDDDLFTLYFQSFVNGIGDDNFRKDTKNKKVIGTVKSSNVSIPLFPHDKQYIDGVIEGGKYGIRREYADTEQDKKIIGENTAVLDQYYILLYTPLNSRIGLLLVQSYTEESIQDSFKDFISTFFSCNDFFYNIIIEPFVPQNIVDKYMKETSIRMFSFTTKTALPPSLRDNVQIKGQTFEVEIKIKPLDEKLNPNAKETFQIIKTVGDKLFDGKPLNEGKAKAYIEDTKKRKANYDIEKEINSIRPTIYLEDAGIVPDETTGLPDFKAIQGYCLQVLQDIKDEFKKKQDIREF